MLSPYYNKWDIREIDRAVTFEVLRDIALRITRRMPAPVGMVCGPISSGGTSSKENNLGLFKSAIYNLVGQGETMFDQLPFEESMWRIMLDKAYYKGETQLLDSFYGPIFSSEPVKRFYFMRDWETSIGASWEHARIKELGLEIIYLSRRESVSEAGIRKAIELYRKKLMRDLHILSCSVRSHAVKFEPPEQLSHCFSMLDQVEHFLKLGESVKAARWLCFIQGVLFANQQYSVDELKKHDKTP